MSAIRKEEIYEYGYGGSKKQDYKKKTQKRRKNQTLEIVRNLFYLASVFIMSTIIIFNYAQITERQYEFSQLEKDIKALEEDIETYNIILFTLNGTNIDKMAQNYLGMDYPKLKQIVYVDVHENDIIEKPTFIGKITSYLAKNE